MDTMISNIPETSCPVCSKNLKVVKKRVQVTVDERTYCCQGCANLDGINAKALKSGRRHSVTRSPFAQRIN